MSVFDARLVRRVRSKIRAKSLQHPKFVSTFYAALASIKAGKGDIWITPETPRGNRFTIEKIAAQLGLTITAAPTDRTAIGLALLNNTKTDLLTHPTIRVLNSHCTDISKERVQHEFAKAFGYELKIDPTKHVGQAVSKSDENATHDGQIITCPVPAREPDKVYERLVNNVHGDSVEDLRVPIVGDNIPLVYRKLRFRYDRFFNTNHTTITLTPAEAFTEKELASILKFARGMQMDFGELDVLRDRDTGLIYIVDANKTPWGPPPAMPFFKSRKAVRLLASAFERSFLQPAASNSPDPALATVRAKN